MKVAELSPYFYKRWKQQNRPPASIRVEWKHSA